MQITFKPTCGPVASASRNATLSLADNAPGSPQSIALSGTGTGNFCFIIPSGDSTSASVSPGQTGSYTLQMEAADGFTGSVGVACAGTPANSTCTIAPASANIGGSELATLTVSVATSAGNGTSFVPRAKAPNELWPIGLGVLAALAVLIVVLRIHCAECRADVAAARRLGARGRAALACTTLLLACAVAGCGAGGGSSNPPPDPATPAGTYTITVTGSVAGGASQSIALTLTVE